MSHDLVERGGSGNMLKHILLAYDGSHHSRKAAELAGTIARQQKPPAIVRVVCAVEPISADLGEPNFSRVAGERRLAGERCVEEARRVIGEGRSEEHTS